MDISGHLGPLGAVLGVFGAIVAWAYQAASARLGVVDLFACEIGTLCRVSLVADVATVLVNTYNDAGQKVHPGRPTEDMRPISPSSGLHSDDEMTSRQHDTAEAIKFTSQEEYFPVFTANSRDLEILEADVVVNITAFYTYMKAFRDAYRRLADIARPERTEPESNSEPDRWHAAMRDAIYMMFLGLESGRMAIDRLIEFEPFQAESDIEILLSEIPLYSFLLKKFDEKSFREGSNRDFRYTRLAFRRVDYDRMISKLKKRVETGLNECATRETEPKRRRHKAWTLAVGTLNELIACYNRDFDRHEQFLPELNPEFGTG
jgi:hypothetical protein